jgi:hypothetical protein
MTGILEKPTTKSTAINVHCLFSVRNMFFSNFRTGWSGVGGLVLKWRWLDLNLWAASLQGAIDVDKREPAGRA